MCKLKLLTLASMLLIVTSYPVYGQRPGKSKKDKEEVTELKKPLDDKIDQQLIQRFTYREFRRIYFPNVQNGFGNYASIDLSKTSVDFSGNIVTKKGDVFGLKVNGGVSDGISSIFSNNKWNTEFSINASYNLMQPVTKKIRQKNRDKSGGDTTKFIFYKHFEYSVSTKKEFIKQKYAIITAYQMDLINAEAGAKISALQAKMMQLMKDSNQLSKSIAELKAKNFSPAELTNFALADSTRITTLSLLKSNEVKLNVKMAQLDSLRTEIKFLNSDTYYHIRKADLKKKESIKKLMESFPIYGYRIQWFTFGAGFSTNQFRSINATEPFGNQIKKTGYGSTFLNVQFSEYAKSLKRFKSYYYNISISGKLGDNFSTLNGQSITEKTQLGTVPDSRYKEDKYTAYAGTYKTDILSATFKADLYYFISNTQRIALHIAPKYEVYQELQPTTSFGTGVYFSFTNTVKDKDPVNLEVFYDFNNVGATNNPSLKKQYQRNQVGVRFIFPFNFNK